MTDTLKERLDEQTPSDVTVYRHTDLLSAVYVEGNGFSARVMDGDEFEVKYNPKGSDSLGEPMHIGQENAAVKEVVRWVKGQRS